MVTIRRIDANEGPAFRAIRLQAIAESPTAFGSTLAETAARTAQYWAGRAQSGAAGQENILFVAEDADGWVGIAGGFLDGADPPGVDLVSMWVHPGHRQQGVGRALVSQVVGWARERGASRVVLWVTESNAGAVSLYGLCGFADTGATQALPSHPILLERQMVLDLKDSPGQSNRSCISSVDRPR